MLWQTSHHARIADGTHETHGARSDQSTAKSKKDNAIHLQISTG